MEAKVVTAPEICVDAWTVFLGGTIAGGRAPNWQNELVAKFPNREVHGDQIVWMNPRRAVWTEDDGWEQVNWEINAQQNAWRKVYWFELGFDSPVTLMEVGLFADSKTVVGCDREYKYRLNVEAAQQIKRFILVNTWDDFVEAVDDLIKEDGCFNQ